MNFLSEDKPLVRAPSDIRGINHVIVTRARILRNVLNLDILKPHSVAKMYEAQVISAFDTLYSYTFTASLMGFDWAFEATRMVVVERIPSRFESMKPDMTIRTPKGNIYTKRYYTPYPREGYLPYRQACIILFEDLGYCYVRHTSYQDILRCINTTCSMAKMGNGEFLKAYMFKGQVQKTGRKRIL